jgi:hypothetical protein
LGFYSQRPEQLIDRLLGVVHNGQARDYKDIIEIYDEIMNNENHCKQNLCQLNKRISQCENGYLAMKKECLEGMFQTISTNWGQECSMLSHLSDQFAGSKTMETIHDMNLLFIDEVNEVLRQKNPALYARYEQAKSVKNF